MIITESFWLLFYKVVVRRPSVTLLTAVSNAADGRHTCCTTAAVRAAGGRRTITKRPQFQLGYRLIALPLQLNIVRKTGITTNSFVHLHNFFLWVFT